MCTVAERQDAARLAGDVEFGGIRAVLALVAVAGAVAAAAPGGPPGWWCRRP